MTCQWNIELPQRVFSLSPRYGGKRVVIDWEAGSDFFLSPSSFLLAPSTKRWRAAWPPGWLADENDTKEETWLAVRREPIRSEVSKKKRSLRLGNSFMNPYNEV